MTNPLITNSNLFTTAEGKRSNYKNFDKFEVFLVSMDAFHFLNKYEKIDMIYSTYLDLIIQNF